MRIGWVGFHQEGLRALRAVAASGHEIVGIVTLEPEAAALRSGSSDYQAVAHELDLPLHFVKNINDEEAVATVRAMAPDLMVVVGWTQLLHETVLQVPTIGVVGAHASLLPDNRGRAPVNWAIINGEERTGNTLMWLSPGVDDGDIIDQKDFVIAPYDSCASIYDKVAESNRDMVLDLLAALAQGERPGRPQPESTAPLLPRRRPADGRIDWSLPARSVYDLVRGVTRPYPGAFTTLGHEKVMVWNCALLPMEGKLAGPGTGLGAVVSPESAACGQLVACGTGAVVLLEVETDTLGVVSGYALQDQDWRGRVMGDG